MNTRYRIASIAEAAELKAAGITARAAKTLGVLFPVAGSDDTLLKEVQKLDHDLEGLRTDAGSKWTALEEVKTKVASRPADAGPLEKSDPLFAELDTAGKAYGEVSDKIATREADRKRLTEIMAQSGITPPAQGNGDTKSASELLAELKSQMGGVQLREAGLAVVESDAYKELKKSGMLESKAALGVRALGEGWSREEVKALLTSGSPTSGGAFTTPQQQGYYALPLRPLTVLDLITIGQTDSPLIEYVRMTSLTNNAAPVAEATSDAPIGDGTGGTVTPAAGGRKPQSDMAFERVQEGVSTIAHWVASTRRAIADAGQLRTIIDGSLRWGLDAAVEAQIVAGDGTGENLRGLLQTTGMNSVAAGAESIPDKISHGITAIRLDQFEPTGIVLNPLDAEVVRLMRTNEGGAGTGAYLFGGPQNPGPATLWGLPIAETPAMPQGTALVGALRAAIFWLHTGAQIMASDSHEDFFTRNLIAVLAELTGGFGVPTPQAFAEVDLAAA